jgi:DNA-binding CsgD family transcriptional regulator/tetratricopeptide (TPR) repeat protein
MSLLPIGVTEPIDALIEESITIHRADPLEAHGIAVRARDLSVAAGYTSGEAQSLFRAAAALRLLGRRDEALANISAAEAIFTALNDQAGLLRCMNHRATLLRDAGSENEAIVLFDAVTVRAEELGDKHTLFSAYSGLVSAFEAIGDQLGVLESSANALCVAREIGSDRTIGIALCNAANAELEFENWANAIELFEESVPVLERVDDHDSLATAFVNTGYAHWRAGTSDAARFAYEKALEYATVHTNPRMQLVAESCLGYLFAEPGNGERARIHVENSLKLADEFNFVAERAQVLLKAGEVYALLGDVHSAVAHFERALDVAAGFTAIREEICSKLAPVLAGINDYERAYVLSTECLSLAADRQRREREYGIRAVKIRQELRKQREDHARVLEEKHKLEDAARGRDRELTQLALNLAERYELLQSIREQLIAASGDKRAIVRAIDRHVEATDGWRTFELQFQSIYADFTASLLQRCQDLTPTELRICSLLKLGLSSKQIADSLCASPRTIEWHRTSIRKKLRLALNDNLTTFLSAIGLSNGSTP